MMVFFAAAAVLAGCHGDPNARKQKYFESGQRYSAEGKYREAAIQFSNALKIDKGYADAHYALAQTYVHLGQFSGAYAELARTVELQPTNYKARIDLGNLLIAAGKTDEAQAQANAVSSSIARLSASASFCACSRSASSLPSRPSVSRNSRFSASGPSLAGLPPVTVELWKHSPSGVRK